MGRALAQLGIKHIAAYSPEARGRSERMFRTLQDRLPKEFRLAGITTIEAANRWLVETGIGELNEEFQIEPAEGGTAFVTDTAELWRETLCVEEERVVAKDNTVAWNGHHLQLPESRLRPHFVRATVRVHEYPDGTTSVHLGPHRLADYTAAGGLLFAPTASSMASCSPPSRRGLETPPPAAPAACRPSLTASARAASGETRVGAKERASSRTKERRGKKPGDDRRQTA